jgi:hypothetical protein
MSRFPGNLTICEENSMLRPALIGVVALGFIAGGASAQGKMDCGALYKSALEKFHKEKAAGVSAEKIANVNRIALRAFDACSAGDEFNATEFFRKLDEEAR